MMSGLRRSLLTAQPMNKNYGFDEREELPVREDHNSNTDDDSSSASSASSASSTGTVVAEPSQNLFARPSGVILRRSLDPIPWTSFFERELFLPAKLADGKTLVQHVYLTSPVGSSPLFVMHHGAGSSGLSFAVLTAEIRKLLPTAGSLSLDTRGHGSTSLTSGDEIAHEGTIDLSLETLTADLHAAITATATKMSWSLLPPIVLIGHSLGGAVVTNLAHQHMLGDALLGYCVLDVVEGSAIDALQSMQNYLSTRPTGFSTISNAIDWHIRSRTVRNSASARASVPSLLVETTERDIGSKISGNFTDISSEMVVEQSPSNTQQDGDVAAALATTPSMKKYIWRTDLSATQRFWSDWFVGLSRKFLTAKGAKLLILAGTDRLDKELMIGQMQGKYALQVFPDAGHFVHEDVPAKVAGVLVDFWRRNDRAGLVLPPKVSELLAMGKKV